MRIPVPQTPFTFAQLAETGQTFLDRVEGKGKQRLIERFNGATFSFYSGLPDKVKRNATIVSLKREHGLNAVLINSANLAEAPFLRPAAEQYHRIAEQVLGGYPAFEKDLTSLAFRKSDWKAATQASAHWRPNGVPAWNVHPTVYHQFLFVGIGDGKGELIGGSREMMGQEWATPTHQKIGFAAMHPDTSPVYGQALHGSDVNRQLNDILFPEECFGKSHVLTFFVEGKVVGHPAAARLGVGQPLYDLHVDASCGADARLTTLTNDNLRLLFPKFLERTPEKGVVLPHIGFAADLPTPDGGSRRGFVVPNLMTYNETLYRHWLEIPGAIDASKFKDTQFAHKFADAFHWAVWGNLENRYLNCQVDGVPVHPIHWDARGALKLAHSLDIPFDLSRLKSGKMKVFAGLVTAVGAVWGGEKLAA